MAVGKKAVREKAETDVLGSVGAPMAGTVIEVQVRPSPCVQLLRGCARVAGWLGVCCAALRAAAEGLRACVKVDGRVLRSPVCGC